jgi:mono/diheme cytochrome c family protein
MRGNDSTVRLECPERPCPIGWHWRPASGLVPAEVSRLPLRNCCGLVCALACALAAALPAGAQDKSAPVDFFRDVQPIFARHCYSCHGPDEQKSGLRLDQRAEALAGGDRGTAIEPGDSEDSRLIQYVTGMNDDEIIMPPEDERLSAQQIKTLRRWIDEGAKWPENRPKRP